MAAHVEMTQPKALQIVNIRRVSEKRLFELAELAVAREPMQLKDLICIDV